MSNSLISSTHPSSHPNRVSITHYPLLRRPSSNCLNFSPIPDSKLPLCKAFALGKPLVVPESGKEGIRQEFQCQLWNPEWSLQITQDGEAFLEEAGCLGYTEDQSLAVLYVCKFDVQMARERLPKFRNIYIPMWSEADKQTFQTLLSTYGKKFSSFRQRLPHIPMKEMVNYYYYQKQLKKKESRTAAVLTKKSLELARRRMTRDNLAGLIITPMFLSCDEKIMCGACFKLRSNIFRFGEEHNMCAECYSYYRINQSIPPLPSDTTNANSRPPSTLFCASRGVRGDAANHHVPSVPERVIAPQQETCTVLVKAKTLGLLREHRRELQQLTKVKEMGPTSAQHAQLMQQIRTALSEDGGHARNVLAVIELDR